MTKIIFTSCQYDAVKMMREDMYSPIKTVSSLWPDFRLTCANVCFLFPPSFTTKLVHREKSDWIWLNHVWQETSQIHSIAKPLSHRRDSFWIFVISELHIVCLLYRNSIAVCSRWKTVYSSLARSRIFTQTLITSTAIYLSHRRSVKLTFQYQVINVTYIVYKSGKVCLNPCIHFLHKTTKPLKLNRKPLCSDTFNQFFQSLSINRASEILKST